MYYPKSIDIYIQRVNFELISKKETVRERERERRKRQLKRGKTKKKIRCKR